MVKFKQSPIEPFEPFKKFPPDTELWVMRDTWEVFLSYDSYLRKLDYYNQKLFTCEITGHRHLTYFEAVQSEKLGTSKIENCFPDALREPVLRKVQHSQIGKTDDLVNYLHELFKDDFFVGEKVTFQVRDGEKLEGIIREKVMAPANRNGVSKSFCRYFVTPVENSGQEAIVEPKNLSRDRKSFTKHVLRSFLKQTLTRDTFEGAPWCVKDNIAKQYGIETKLPIYLDKDVILAERKSAASLKKLGHKAHPPNGITPKSDLKSAAQELNEHRGKLPTELVIRFNNDLESCRNPSALPKSYSHPAPEYIHFKPGKEKPSVHVAPKLQPPPPEIKYPIEDLDVKPRTKRASRPALKNLVNDILTQNSEDHSQESADIDTETVGLLLELWTTLNVHSQYFLIDSFTFDDFLDSMLFSSSEVTCQLFHEIHCAILKKLVKPDGTIDAYVPSIDTSSESSSTSSSQQTSPGPDQSTRSQSQANQAVDEDEPTTLSNSHSHRTLYNGYVTNRAQQMSEQDAWVNRIRARDFDNGGWQVAMVGLLDHLVSAKEGSEALEEILRYVAPTDQPANQQTARQQYSTLDVNLRVKALQTIMVRAMTTRSFKDSMEERGDKQTVDRKAKIEIQKDRKLRLSERKQLVSDSHYYRPVNGETQESMNVDEEEEEDSDVIHVKDSDTEDEAPRRGRRVSNRANDLKRKREREEEAEKKAKAKKEDSEAFQYRKALEKLEQKEEEIIDCEEKIAEFDSKLRQNACHRTHCLGTDRFFNRYWWFEYNGMSVSGQKGSSTKSHDYMNGRLWIQGPGITEREGFLDRSPAEMKAYTASVGMTIPERRKLEEGSTILFSPEEWGFYSTPTELNNLIRWLDPDHGIREKALHRELDSCREEIAEYMEKMNKYRQECQEKKDNLEEPTVGIATRRPKFDKNMTVKNPCLAWQNTCAMRELGHLHSDGPGPRRIRGVATTRGLDNVRSLPMHSGRRETRRGTKF